MIKSKLKIKPKKSSFFNIFFDINGSYFIYNTLYGSLIKITEEVKKAIKENKPDDLSVKTITLLTKSRVVIDKNFDEKKYINKKTEESKQKSDKTHIFFTITRACNCNCLYCFENKDVSEESDDFGWIIDFTKKITKRNKSKVLLMDFFGGEPMLKWRKISLIISELIKFGKENNIIVQFRFYTNGTIMSPEILNFLEKNRKNIKDFQITIDGNKKIHDTRRPLKTNKSSYEKIINNISLFYKNNIPVKIRINIDNANIDSIPDLLKNLKKYEWHKLIPIYFYCVQDLGESCSGYKAVFNDDQVAKELNKLWIFAIEQGFKVNLKPIVKFVYCSSFNKASYVVDNQHNLYKCAVLQDPKHVIGKIKNNGDIKIENKVALKDWISRNSLNITTCQGCKLLPTCASGCGGSAFNRFGTHHINNCAGNKKLFFDKLRLYVKNKYKI